MKVSSKVNAHMDKMEQELEQLTQLHPEELRKRWQKSFGSSPPPRLRPSLMVRAVAYRLQEKGVGRPQA